MQLPFIWLAVVLAITLVVSVSAEPVARFPGATWQRSRPNQHGFDEAKLKDALEFPFSRPLSQSYCVSIHRNGLLIADRYAEGVKPTDTALMYSTSKAVMISIVGMLEHQKLLSRDDLVSRYVPEWRHTPAESITVDMILRMDSGRYYDLITDFVLAQFQPSQTNFSIGLDQQHPPGTHDQYNQMAFQILQRIFSVVVPHMSINDWFQRAVMQPMQWESRAFWREESFFIPVPNDPLVYGGLHASCHDLARFGQLWLHKGQWNSMRLFDERFWQEGLERPAAPRAGRRYHWGGGPNHRATGMGGQFVTFNREKDLVITRIGDPFGVGWSPGEFVDKVMASLLDGPGSWNVTEDARQNPPEVEEQVMSRALHHFGGIEGFGSAWTTQPMEVFEFLQHAKQQEQEQEKL